MLGITAQDKADALKLGVANDLYTGIGDRSIDFGQGSNFMDANSGEITLELDASGSEKDIQVALCPGYYASAANIKNASGVAVDAIIVDGAFTSGTTPNIKAVTTSCTPQSVADFLAYIFSNPCLIQEIKIVVSDTAQLSKQLYYRELTMFDTRSADSCNPASYMGDGQLNGKQVTIKDKQHWQLDSNHVLLYTLLAGKTATITIKVGAVRNNSTQLATSFKDAKRTVASAMIANSQK